VREGPLGASGSDSLGWMHPAWRALCWGSIYYLAGQVGMLTTLDDRPVNLVAPSAGVLTIWLSLSTRRTLPWDVATIAVLGMALSYQIGLPLGLVLLSPVISLTQAAVFVTIMRRGTHDLAPFRGSRESWRLADLGVFLLAAVTSALTTAVLSAVSQHLAGLPSGDLTTFLARWGRVTSTTAAVGSLGLLVAPHLRRARLEGRVGAAVRSALSPSSPARLVEVVALVVTSLALYVACFTTLEKLPIIFVVFVVTAWVGIRFSPAAAAAHSLLCGVLAMTFTLGGKGIFVVVVADPAQRPAVAQLFVLIISATGLALAIARTQMVAAERLAESRLQMLDQILHEVNDGLMLIQDDGTVLMVNPAGKELFGIDQPFEHVLPAEAFHLYERDGTRLVEERVPFRRALRGETVTGEEYELRRPDGSILRYLRMNAEVLPSLGPGFPPRVLLSYHDVTGDRLRQDALATFAGHVAHDLRNPLTIVEAWNEVLTDAFEAGAHVASTVGLPMTARIGAASTRMRNFIQGLLDYTLARDRTLTRESVDLVALASEVAELRAQASGRLEQPVIRVAGAGAAWADPVLVRIVIDNLLANACKYVAPGVRPEVLVVVEETGQGTVGLSVLDNGIGIPDDEREQVFSSLHRVEQGGGFEGTGLGLGICQRIVERHGGTIVVESVPEGASLRVTLPRAAEPARQPLAATAHPATETPPAPELVAGR
jgi:PAS domain S-box-containing protein